MPPDPPRKPRDFVARSMTNNLGLATPLIIVKCNDKLQY